MRENAYRNITRASKRKKGMTLTRLAEKSGVSKTHINDIENNVKSPSLLVMVKLAKALNVDINELYRVKW